MTRLFCRVCQKWYLVEVTRTIEGIGGAPQMIQWNYVAGPVHERCQSIIHRSEFEFYCQECQIAFRGAEKSLTRTR